MPWEKVVFSYPRKNANKPVVKWLKKSIKKLYENQGLV